MSLVIGFEEETGSILSSVLGMLANLSGFVNALIFFFQRREVYKKASQTIKETNVGELDSDLDTTLFHNL